MNENEWNPRFVAYARANGRLPEEQREHDRALYPGGTMTGFVLWIGARWEEWRAARGMRADHPLSDVDHAAFDRWLNALGREN